MNPSWSFFWEVVLSNALVTVVLAIAVIVIGRFWKRPAAIHLLWVFVVLKLFTPPLITLPVPQLTGAITVTASPAPSDVCLFYTLPSPQNRA